jgi:hypothetical protein
VVGMFLYHLAFGLYRLVDAWGNIDFLLNKFEILKTAGASLWATIVSASAWAVTAFNSNVIQALIYLAGIAWILLTSAPRETGPVQLSLPDPLPGKPNPKEQRAAVERLLTRAIRHGETLIHSDDVAAVVRWDRKTLSLIDAIWGADERNRYANMSGYSQFVTLNQTVEVKIERLRDLGRRLEFNDPPIRSDFNPGNWDTEG